jgi:photosystem II stability/assembly factor-like uncharacterized protein
VTATVAATLHESPQPALNVSVLTFADAQHGWALAQCARAHSTCTVLGTADGGRTWKSLGFTPLAADRLQFLDDRHGFAVSTCRSTPCADTAVLATTDGGATWRVRSSSAALYGVDFVSPDDGWAAAAGGGLVRSTDGGRTWSPVPAPVPGGCKLTAVNFPTPAEGWAGGDGPCLLQTADGGRTWTVAFASAAAPVLAPVLATWGKADPATVAKNMEGSCSATPHFVSASAGWLVVSCGSYYSGGVLVARTADGGRTWRYGWGTPGCLMGCRSEGGTQTPLFFLGDGSTAWREASVPDLGCGATERTPDGGRTWDVLGKACTGPQPGTVAFTDPDHGFMGESTGIFASSDGGADWSRVYPGPTGGPFASVSFVSPDQAFAVPLALTSGIESTADGGTTWQAVYDFGPAVKLGGVDFTDALHGWAWGWSIPSGPLVYATTDGGRSWTSTRAPGQEQPTQVAFADAGIGWLTGASGLLWGTSDGGRHWTQAAAPPGGAVQSFGLVGGTLAWALTAPRGPGGGPCTLWSTSDGGADWTQAARYPKQYPPPVMAFTSSRDGWAANGSSLLETSDGGRTWSRLTWATSAEDLGFIDPQHGWVLADGTLWITSDGGATWSNRA